MKFLKVILIVTNLSLSLLLLGSSASAYVSPLNCWPLAFLGMMFPFFLALLLISFLALLMFRSKWCIISGLALLFTSGFWGKVYQMSGEDSPSYSASKHVKVMSFNVRLFDLYNWSNNRKTREEIIQFIRKENPDVIAFQEYYSNEDGYHIHTDSLKKWLNIEQVHTHFTQTIRNKQSWGIATFSKFPIVGRGTIPLLNSRHNTCIFTDINIPGLDTVRFFNMHLQSIHLKKEDYVFLDNLNKEEIDIKDLKDSESLINKLRLAFNKRAIQADTIRTYIERTKLPVVLCGDFNDTPVSYAYNTLQSGLEDAFCKSGKGFGRTYSGIMPTMRIDYILHSPQIKSHGFSSRELSLSDHFPIICYLEKKLIP